MSTYDAAAIYTMSPQDIMTHVILLLGNVLLAGHCIYYAVCGIKLIRQSCRTK